MTFSNEHLCQKNILLSHLFNSMARTFSLPLTRSKPYYANHLHTIFTFPNCSETRIMSFVFNNPNKTTTFYGLQNVRGLTSISVTSLPVISNSHHNIRKSCSFFGVPPFSVFPFYRSCSSSLRFSVISQNNDHAVPTSQDSIKTIRCAIKGRVQGVFYRNWTIENATQLGLKGWVRNRRDRSVEALFSGNTEAVDEMM